MTDDEFLRGVEPYMSDATILAAYDVAHDLRSLEVACAYYDARPTVVEALLGRLRGACVKGGRVRSTGATVDPRAEPAIWDPNDIHLAAAFAVYRTVARRRVRPLLVRYGERAH